MRAHRYTCTQLHTHKRTRVQSHQARRVFKPSPTESPASWDQLQHEPQREPIRFHTYVLFSFLCVCVWEREGGCVSTWVWRREDDLGCLHHTRRQGLSLTDLELEPSRFSWLSRSPRELSLFLSTQEQATRPCYFAVSLTQVLGLEFRSPCLQGKYCTDWAIFWAPSFWAPASTSPWALLGLSLTYLSQPHAARSCCFLILGVIFYLCKL